MYGHGAVRREAARGARSHGSPFVVKEAGGAGPGGEGDFLQAVRCGDFRRAVDGLAAGADLDRRAARGLSPLMLAAMACGAGAAETLRLLLEARAEVDAHDDAGCTALLHACRAGRRSAVELLIKGRASPAACTRDGRTAPVLAVQGSADGLVPYLLGRRAQVERKDRQGWTLLFHACEHGRPKLVRWLLAQQGVDAAEPAKGGLTVLMIAARQGDLGLAAMLAERRADPDARDHRGNSVLMIAIQAKETEFAKWLLEEGVDVMAENDEGQLAVDIAAGVGMGAGSLMDTLVFRSGERHSEGEEHFALEEEAEHGGAAARSTLSLGLFQSTASLGAAEAS